MWFTCFIELKLYASGLLPAWAFLFFLFRYANFNKFEYSKPFYIEDFVEKILHNLEREQAQLSHKLIWDILQCVYDRRKAEIGFYQKVLTRLQNDYTVIKKYLFVTL